MRLQCATEREEQKMCLYSEDFPDPVSVGCTLRALAESKRLTHWTGETFDRVCLQDPYGSLLVTDRTYEKL
jgi:hypothetical protein